MKHGAQVEGTPTLLSAMTSDRKDVLFSLINRKDGTSMRFSQFKSQKNLFLGHYYILQFK